MASSPGWEEARLTAEEDLFAPCRLNAKLMALYEGSDSKWYLRAESEHFHTLVNDLRPTCSKPSRD